MNQSEVEDAIMAYMFTVRGNQVDQSQLLREFHSIETNPLTIHNATQNLIRENFLQQMSHFIAIGTKANKYITHKQRAIDTENERIEKEKSNKKAEDIDGLKKELLEINIELGNKQNKTFIKPLYAHIINGLIALIAAVSLYLTYSEKSQIQQMQQQLKPLQHQIDSLKSRLDSLPVQNSYLKSTK